MFGRFDLWLVLALARGGPVVNENEEGQRLLILPISNKLICVEYRAFVGAVINDKNNVGARSKRRQKKRGVRRVGREKSEEEVNWMKK